MSPLLDHAEEIAALLLDLLHVDRRPSARMLIFPRITSWKDHDVPLC